MRTKNKESVFTLFFLFLEQWQELCGPGILLIEVKIMPSRNP